MSLNVLSLFAGCGGLDLGFSKAGFTIPWANEYDKDCWKTYEQNHPATHLDRRDIRKVLSEDLPDCIGIIGGSPCQSWSEAGKQRGISDDRGKLFWEYIRLLKSEQPLFFVAENVGGMLHKKHSNSLKGILQSFNEADYTVSYKLLNAVNYGVPQDRERVFFVGYHKSLKKSFSFENLIPIIERSMLSHAIEDLQYSVLPALSNNQTNGARCEVPNHEYFVGGYSSRYMSRNRVRSWDEPSFTIQAGARHAPIHPQSPPMIRVERDVFTFAHSPLQPIRRLSVRECARIQTFPDEFVFYYDNVATGYKLVGNAVPVALSYTVARAIRHDLF